MKDDRDYQITCNRFREIEFTFVNGSKYSIKVNDKECDNIRERVAEIIGEKSVRFDDMWINMDAVRSVYFD